MTARDDIRGSYTRVSMVCQPFDPNFRLPFRPAVLHTCTITPVSNLLAKDTHSYVDYVAKVGINRRIVQKERGWYEKWINNRKNMN